MKSLLLCKALTLTNKKAKAKPKLKSNIGKDFVQIAWHYRGLRGKMILSVIDNYQKRMTRVIEYIEQNIDEKINLDDICNVAAFSKYHFHRLFGACFGLNIYQYLQLARLKRATTSLAHLDKKPIIEIALDAGFDSPQAFARAFRANFGQSPSQFRKSPNWDNFQNVVATLSAARRKAIEMSNPKYEVKIVEFAGVKLASIIHDKPKNKIYDTVANFIEWRKSVNLPPQKSATFNVFHTHDDVAPSDYKLEIGAVFDAKIAANKYGIIASEIPKGKCAVIRYIGNQDNFGPASEYLYGQWYPKSGEEMRDFPLFCELVKFRPFVNEAEEIMDIYLPIK